MGVFGAPGASLTDGGSFSRTHFCTGLTSIAGFCLAHDGGYHTQNAATGKLRAFAKKYQWSGREDSNLRLVAPEASALPAELRRKRNRVIEGKQLKVQANCKNLDCGQDLVIRML